MKDNRASNRRAPPEPSHVRGRRPSSREEIEQTWRIRFLQEGVTELGDMYVRQSMPWTTGKQPLTRGGNLLVLNTCLDYFLDGLSDGRRRSQLPLQSISNKSSANQPASISVRNSNPPVVDATELATAHSINQQSVNNQSVNNQSISQSAINQPISQPISQRASQ